MKFSILILLFFSLASVTAQNKKIKQSDLVGYWKHESVINLNGQRHQVFIRTEKNTKNYFGIWYFDKNGNYSVVYTRRIGRKCGNELFSKKHKPSNGTYAFDNVNQEVNLLNKNTQETQTSQLIWIDRNRFARIIVN